MTAIHKKYPIEIVRELREISGRNDKITYLTEALNKNANFRLATEYAYNPYKNYYISSTEQLLTILNKGSFGSSRGYRELPHVLQVLDSINKHGSANGRLKTTLYHHMCELNGYDIEIVDLILKGGFDCGISVASINKALPGLIPTFKTALCEKLSKKSLEKIEYPAFAQLKMDGMRALIFVDEEKVVIRSRNGKELTTHEVFRANVLKLLGRKSKCVLDGELLTVNDKGVFDARRISNGICNKAVRGTISEEEADKLVFVCWDVFSIDTFWSGVGKIPYFNRFFTISKLIETNKPSNIKLVENIEVDSYFEANRYFEKCLERGEEGIILKNKNAPYEAKRSCNSIKFKSEKTADLVITEVVEGAGKYSGLLGAFRCTTKDGELQVSVGTGISDQQRSEYFSNGLVGQIIEVKYNEIIEDKFGDKSLFLPVFVQVRNDKDIANTFQELS